MIAIIDYSMGNLHSVKNALDFLKAESVITDDAETIKRADKIILPGVGAFPDAVAALKDKKLFGLVKDIANSGKPFMGICLGMQLLFEYGNEFARTEGLGLIKGEVVLLDAKGEKIPHIGWDSLNVRQNDEVLEGVNSGEYVYFVHSFRASTEAKNILCDTFYGESVPALVKADKLLVYGAQFHPEKSHRTGLRILKNFIEMKR